MNLHSQITMNKIHEGSMRIKNLYSSKLILIYSHEYRSCKLRTINPSLQTRGREFIHHAVGVISKIRGENCPRCLFWIERIISFITSPTWWPFWSIKICANPCNLWTKKSADKNWLYIIRKKDPQLAPACPEHRGSIGEVSGKRKVN